MGKNILIIYFENLLPADTGSKKNTFNLLCALKKSGFNITLFCCYSDQPNHADIHQYVDRLIELKNPLSKWIYKLPNAFFNLFEKNPIKQNALLKFILRKELKSEFKKCDTILLNYVTYADIIPDNCFSKSILFTHDLLYYRTQQFYNQKGNLDQHVAAVKSTELALLRKFNQVLVVADYELAILKTEGFANDKLFNIGAPQEVTNLPYIEFPYYFGFIGGKYEQNVEALKKFINEYYVHFSDKTFAVAGSVGSVSEIKELVAKFPNIKVLGFVDDLVQFYSNVRFIAATLPMGSGIKIKVLEALSFGKIVLGTDKAFEGVNPLHLVHAIDVQKIEDVQYLKSLLLKYEEKSTYVEMAEQAKKLVEDNFSQQRLFQPLIDTIK
jgi:glycosyltransferase involved in cell wall biosynthesis